MKALLEFHGASTPRIFFVTVLGLGAKLVALPGNDTSKLGLRALRSIVGLVPQEGKLGAISSPY